MIVKTLNDMQIRNLKPKDSPYRECADKNLYVEVSPAGKKTWRFRTARLLRLETTVTGCNNRKTETGKEMKNSQKNPDFFLAQSGLLFGADTGPLLRAY